MRYFTVHPLGAEFAINVRAPSEARARLIAAIWFLSTPLRSSVTRSMEVLPLLRQVQPFECINDNEEFEQLEQALTELVTAAVRS